MFLLSQACDSQIKIVPPLLSNTEGAPVITLVRYTQGRLTSKLFKQRRRILQLRQVY
jgi:hypothetical protein